MALGPLMVLHKDAKWDEANRWSQTLFDKYVDKALERKRLPAKSSEPLHNRGSNSDALINKLAETLHDKIELRNAAMHAFFAAHETTANLISNMFFLLARHPRVWQRLRDEVLSLGYEILDFEGPSNLVYLRNVIDESEYILCFLASKPVGVPC